MAIKLKDIKFGHATIDDLAYWINERHSIYNRKFYRHPKPWTEDKIFQQYKFTNAFRQLDKGTLALKEMLTGIKLPALMSKEKASGLLFFNIVWYRLFNWYEHAEELGFVTEFEQLETYIQKRFRAGKKIFTGAHMTTGVAYEGKHVSYLRAAREAWTCKVRFSACIQKAISMEEVFNKLLDLYMVGRFVAYELVCDLRFTKLLENATDKLTWANLGPGAQRGLKRLGLPYDNQLQGVTSMQLLYYRLKLNEEGFLGAHVLNAGVPFELREVEHSLCEFDKYQRVKRGEGRPRSKYNGTG